MGRYEVERLRRVSCDGEPLMPPSIACSDKQARTVAAVDPAAGMLVLTISHEAHASMSENGAPIWAAISLIRDGESMKTAQMLERSQTIKRGVGKQQPD